MELRSLGILIFSLSSLSSLIFKLSHFEEAMREFFYAVFPGSGSCQAPLPANFSTSLR